MRVTPLFCLLLASVFSDAGASPWRFDGVERIVAVSDLHGAHGAFVQTLQAAELIDDNERWIAGATHLVIVGDIVDRGDDSRDSMDLLIRLEVEAEAAGGRVHVLLGNHEAMVLIGDLRYVTQGEFAAFSAEETDEERERWYRALVARDGDTDRAAFDADYPAGFFGHRAGYAADGQYGAWLLQKPALVIINDIAFIHAGLSPVVGRLGPEAVNVGLVGELREYVEMLPGLYADSAVLPTDELFEREALLGPQIDALTETGADTARLERLERAQVLERSVLHGPDGPLWYRGNVACSALVEIDRLGLALDKIDADRAVIGHTPTPTRQVVSRFGGRIIEIDTGMNNAYYKGSGFALAIEGDELTVISQSGERSVGVMPHPRQVGSRPGGFLSIDDTEAVLRDGQIISRSMLGNGRTAYVVESEGHRLQAVFEAAGRRGVLPELAAYRLDRLLGLDMVPATVERTIDGKRGSLQFLVPRTINEGQRIASGQGGGAMCPLSDQWQSMYVFDALVHNEGRRREEMRYDRIRGFQLILTGHERAFSSSRGFPSYLSSIDLQVTGEWKRRLEALDDSIIEAKFGDVLDRRRRAALAGRRDLLLKSGD
ncbi:MAG: metallophosphoesterase [Pseudomonadota bacterium]